MHRARAQTCTIASILLCLLLPTAVTAQAAGGATWRLVPPANPNLFPILYSVSMSSATEGWAVGYDKLSDGFTYPSLAEHWNGSSWQVVSTPNPYGPDNILQGVVDLSPTNAWAVGYSSGNTYKPLIEHWNGKTWSAVTAGTDRSGSEDELYGVAAVSASNIWAVGQHFDARIGGFDGLTEHWNGTAWSVVTSPSDVTILTSVTGISGNDVWAVGQSDPETPAFEHWNGQSWSISFDSSTPNAYMTGVTHISSSDVWAVGYWAPTYGAAYQTLTEHWNGSGWSAVPSANPAAGIPNLLLGVSALSSNDVWAVGYDYLTGDSTVVEQWNGSTWTAQSTPVPAGSQYNYLESVASASGGTVLAVGRSDSGTLAIISNNG